MKVLGHFDSAKATSFPCTLSGSWLTVMTSGYSASVMPPLPTWNVNRDWMKKRD